MMNTYVIHKHVTAWRCPFILRECDPFVHALKKHIQTPYDSSRSTVEPTVRPRFHA